MKHTDHFFQLLRSLVTCSALLTVIVGMSPLLAKDQMVVSDSELDLPEGMELVPESDPLYAQTKQAFSTVFGSPNEAVDASPKLEMGPVLRTDGNGQAIVTFKAAAGKCAQYAFAPTEDAIKDNIEIKFVSNDRLPDNRKWSADNDDKKLSEAIPRFRFNKAVTSQFNDSGYSSSHGSWAAKDTNHNWGFRLYKDGKLLTKKADYEKYARHMISSNPTQAKLASDISIDEGELLIKWGLADQEFKKNVLDPMLKLAQEIASEAEASGEPLASAIKVEKLARIGIGAAAVLALLFMPITPQWGIIGSVAIIQTVVSYGKQAAAACDARKPSHQESELRHVVILAR